VEKSDYKFFSIGSYTPHSDEELQKKLFLNRSSVININKIKEYVEKEYNWNNISNNYFQCLQRIINN